MNRRTYWTALILIFFSIILHGQTDRHFAFGAEINVVQSDLNYGNEFVLDYLQNDYYTHLSASNDPGTGYNAQLAIYYNLLRKNELKLKIGFTQLSEDVLGEVKDLKSSIMRPLSDEIPTSVFGKVNYNTINIGASFTRNFRGNYKSGLSMSLGIDYKLNLGADWNVDVTYEDGFQSEHKDLSEFSTADLNDLFFANIQVGYNISLLSVIRFTPVAGMHLGLNSIDGDTLNPSYFSFGLQLKLL